MSDHARATSRHGTLLATTALTATCAVLALTTSAAAALRAAAARALNVTDTAELHKTGESGASIIDQGKAKGTLPGNVRVAFNVGVTVTAAFSITTHNGSISGHGSGTLNEAKHKPGHINVYASFGGTMKVTHGTGRYAHAHGTGGFYGVINRQNYSVTLQTTGALSY
jgi:hypothetical protein